MSNLADDHVQRESKHRLQTLREAESVLAILLETTRSSITSLERSLGPAVLNQFAPISALPPELLAQIFDLHQHADIEKHRWEQLDSEVHNGLPPIAVVATVSKAFRAVALGTPSLWTDIKYQPNMIPPSFIKLMFERSGSCLIDVRFRHITIVDFHWTNKNLDIQRLRSLSIVVSSAHDMQTLCQLVRKARLPNLRSLSLVGPDDFEEPIKQPIFLAGAPSLQAVSFQQISLLDGWGVLHKTSLTHLELIDSPTVMTDYALLTSVLADVASSLTHLSLAVKFDEDEVNEPILLPKLQSMRIFQLNYGINRPYRWIHAPLINQLSIVNTGKRLTKDFIDFLQNELTFSPNNSHLESLCFESANCRRLWNTSFVRRLSRLKHLRVVESREEDLLKIFEYDVTLMPHLETFEVSNIEINILRKFVSRRLEAGFRLKKLVIWFPSLDKKDLGWLRERVDMLKLSELDIGQISWDSM